MNVLCINLRPDINRNSFNKQATFIDIFETARVLKRFCVVAKTLGLPVGWYLLAAGDQNAGVQFRNWAHVRH